jgi:hypothetical protein
MSSIILEFSIQWKKKQRVEKVTRFPLTIPENSVGDFLKLEYDRVYSEKMKNGQAVRVSRRYVQWRV